MRSMDKTTSAPELTAALAHQRGLWGKAQCGGLDQPCLVAGVIGVWVVVLTWVLAAIATCGHHRQGA